MNLKQNSSGDCNCASFVFYAGQKMKIQVFLKYSALMEEFFFKPYCFAPKVQHLIDIALKDRWEFYLH